MKRWQQFTKKELENIVKNSITYVEIAKKCGYNVGEKGGASANIAKEIIAYYGFDDSHLKGQHWKKDLHDDSIFGTTNKHVTPATLKKPLVELRGYKCESCGLDTWLGKPITLEVHHKDGDRHNNNLDNLQLLCPNCHSFTSNWRRKNTINSRQKVSEEIFVNALKNTSTIRQALIEVGLVPCSGNYNRAVRLISKYNIKNQTEQVPNKFVRHFSLYIAQLDEKGNELNKFNTIKEIIEFLGLKGNNSSGLSRALKNSTEYKGYYWKRITKQY